MLGIGDARGGEVGRYTYWTEEVTGLGVMDTSLYHCYS